MNRFKELLSEANDQKTIERIIDKTNFANVLTILSNIAEEKSNQSDNPIQSKFWSKVAGRMINSKHEILQFLQKLQSKK